MRKRVLSHFSADHRYEKDMNISRQLKNNEAVSTAGELGALLKESVFIKKEKPLYNRALRRKNMLTLLLQAQTDKAFNTIRIENRSQIFAEDLESLVGVCTSKKIARELLKERISNHNLCEKIMGIEKKSGPCFGYKLTKCKGACINKENALRYNIRFIEAFGKDKIKPWPFDGAVTIREHDSIEQLTDTFHVNKWCLITSDNDPLIFHYDIYKILVRYLQKHKVGSHLSISEKIPDTIEE